MPLIISWCVMRNSVPGYSSVAMTACLEWVWITAPASVNIVHMYTCGCFVHTHVYVSLAVTQINMCNKRVCTLCWSLFHLVSTLTAKIWVNSVFQATRHSTTPWRCEGGQNQSCQGYQPPLHEDVKVDRTSLVWATNHSTTPWQREGGQNHACPSNQSQAWLTDKN